MHDIYFPSYGIIYIQILFFCSWHYVYFCLCECEFDLFREENNDVSCWVPTLLFFACHIILLLCSIRDFMMISNIVFKQCTAMRKKQNNLFQSTNYLNKLFTNKLQLQSNCLYAENVHFSLDGKQFYFRFIKMWCSCFSISN